MAPPKKRKKTPRKKNAPVAVEKRGEGNFFSKNIFWILFVVVTLSAGIGWVLYDTHQTHRAVSAVRTSPVPSPASAVPVEPSPAQTEVSPPKVPANANFFNSETPPPVTAPAVTSPAVTVTPSVPVPAPAPVTPPPVFSGDANTFPRPVVNLTEAQIELARRCISCGPIDGRSGSQTAAALRAFQASEGIPQTGRLDEMTRSRLLLSSPPLGTREVTAADLARLQPVSPTWLGKSEQSALEYQTILELVAEETHAHHNTLARLNPNINWKAVASGTVVTVPAVNRVSPRGKAARIEIFLEARVLQARDENDRLIAHFPVSIARSKEKRPAGELHVTTVAPNPNYTFNPAVFPESAEAQEIGRKLIIAPGPNNPVGVAWIGLSLPGYGIHGTPDPEKVGRTESHGCFRLANWDAKTLIDLVYVGLPVVVMP